MLSSSWWRLPLGALGRGAEARTWSTRGSGVVSKSRGPWDSVCPCLGLAHLSLGLWFLRGVVVWAPAPCGLSGAPVRVSPGITCLAQLRSLQAGQNLGSLVPTPSFSEEESKTHREQSFTGLLPKFVSRQSSPPHALPFALRPRATLVGQEAREEQGVLRSDPAWHPPTERGIPPRLDPRWALEPLFSHLCRGSHLRPLPGKPGRWAGCVQSWWVRALAQ